jgi:protease PrsW
MTSLLFLSLAPVFIILFYIYFRDKYEKEPWSLLIQSLILGIFLALPVVLIEKMLYYIGKNFTGMARPFWDAFIVASFTEESMKLLALFFLIWKNKAFNDKFDGIVYATFISLGFAGIENVLYVTSYGYATAFSRALTAVPAHALFGISMGYFFGLARFYVQKRKKYLWLSFLVPFALHGAYDFILMAGNSWLLLAFLPFIIFMWVTGFRRMKTLNRKSIFRDDLDLGLDFSKVNEFNKLGND